MLIGHPEWGSNKVRISCGICFAITMFEVIGMCEKIEMKPLRAIISNSLFTRISVPLTVYICACAANAGEPDYDLSKNYCQKYKQRQQNNLKLQKPYNNEHLLTL